jgi:glucosamine-6-phosphate deaminase
VDAVNEYVVGETIFDTGSTKGWTVRGKDFKYTLYDRGRYREQLYDMRSDRGEMVNLAVEAKYRDTLERYRKVLVEWHEKTGVEKVARTTPKVN